MFIEQMCPHDYDTFVHKVCASKKFHAVVTTYSYATYLRIEDNSCGPKCTFEISDFSIKPASHLALSDTKTLNFIEETWKKHLAGLFGKEYINEYKKHMQAEINNLEQALQK